MRYGRLYEHPVYNTETKKDRRGGKSKYKVDLSKIEIKKNPTEREKHLLALAAERRGPERHEDNKSHNTLPKALKFADLSPVQKIAAKGLVNSYLQATVDGQILVRAAKDIGQIRDKQDRDRWLKEWGFVPQPGGTLTCVRGADYDMSERQRHYVKWSKRWLDHIEGLVKDVEGPSAWAEVMVMAESVRFREEDESVDVNEGGWFNDYDAEAAAVAGRLQSQGVVYYVKRKMATLWNAAQRLGGRPLLLKAARMLAQVTPGPMKRRVRRTRAAKRVRWVRDRERRRGRFDADRRDTSSESSYDDPAGYHHRPANSSALAMEALNGSCGEYTN